MEATDAAYDGYWEPYEPATPPPPSPSPYPSPSPSPQSSAFLPVPVTAAAAAAVPAGQRTLRGSQSTSSLRRKLNSSRPIVPPLRSTSVPKRSPVHGGAGAPSAPNPNASTSTLPSNTSSPPNLPSQLYSTSTPPESSRFLRPRASSSASVATSNSSSCHGPPAAPPQQEGLMVGEGDSTALMIKQLYARLDAQGVPGDGWEQGMERSRDGIISREAVEGGKTVGRGMKGIVMRDSVLFPPMAAQTLRRVDRYGFFSSSHPSALSSQHNRLATLRAVPYDILPGSTRKPAKAPPSPPPTPSRPDTLPTRTSTGSVLLPSRSPAEIALELKRIDKWGDMLSVARRDGGGNAAEWTVAEYWWAGRKSGEATSGGKYRVLQRRVLKGIPDRWRNAVWGLEMERMAADKQAAGGRVQSVQALELEYRALIKVPSEHDVQIDLDVPRTISGHVLFHTRYGQGQRALFHVLHAFGIHCNDIGGYCQGMGPIAATLLCYFEPERAYASLVRIFHQYDLGRIFEPGFPGLLEAFYVQERVVEFLMPDVGKAFITHCISTSSYGTKWYITLFSNSVPFSTLLRLWDAFLLEGVDVLVLASVAIIWGFRDEFSAKDASFESILYRLSAFFLVESDDALLRWVRKALAKADLRRKMAEWRVEWQGFVAEGTELRHLK